MDSKQLTELLGRVRSGECPVERAVAELRDWPSERLGCATLDHHRSLRTNVPEVVYGENKSAEQIGEIMQAMLARSYVVMATRVSAEKAAAVGRLVPELSFHAEARMLVGNEHCVSQGTARGPIVILAAGTSDIPVAEEARVTALSLGNPVEKAYDVGVAGLHRLLGQRELLMTATVIIVVAGMEGALPSVVAGLVSKPIIAVPTSIGYGTGFGGIAALLGMLNSCAPGVAVVNIDNGFGAGCVASAINRKDS